ncbi:MAG: hypothetical protein V1913_12380 [Fibrobacterota bacterium]
MQDDFQRLMARLAGLPGRPGLAGSDILSLLRITDNAGPACKLAAAFLIALCGPGHPGHGDACHCLDAYAHDPEWAPLARAFRRSLSACAREMEAAAHASPAFRRALVFAAHGNGQQPLWEVFFPEGRFTDRKKSVARLRRARTVRITRLNPEPLTNPAREILFTSNLLLTLPRTISPALRRLLPTRALARLKKAMRDPQRYWYDHPIPLDADARSHELLYGLRELDKAVAMEKKNGGMGRDEKATCLLSVSVTHTGLDTMIRDYLDALFRTFPPFPNLTVYVFTEYDTRALLRTVIVPAMGKSAGPRDLSDVFGVNGEYGRHYSFLKAVAVFWQVCVDPGVRATFKIDLDQVFPQHELMRQTGRTAFAHFTSPLWGARGLDAEGRPVELGMAAGKLVRPEDAHCSLFTPDVPYPASAKDAESALFFGPRPMALSTEAETGFRYGQGLDGRNRCLQRIHVTGGINGILLSALRKHRPFTPSLFGRAEDQAYLLSVFFAGRAPRLRCVHLNGLVMRHDRDGFASVAVAQAEAGRKIGDLLRIRLFSSYARAVPGGFDRIKSATVPFTGCAISPVPMTLALLRFALAILDLHHNGASVKAAELARLGANQPLLFESGRISDAVLCRCYRTEARAWDVYFKAMDTLESGLRSGHAKAQRLRRDACRIAIRCRFC